MYPSDAALLHYPEVIVYRPKLIRILFVMKETYNQDEKTSLKSNAINSKLNTIVEKR